jgi:hypothetical protein
MKRLFASLCLFSLFAVAASRAEAGTVTNGGIDRLSLQSSLVAGKAGGQSANVMLARHGCGYGGGYYGGSPYYAPYRSYYVSPYGPGYYGGYPYDGRRHHHHGHHHHHHHHGHGGFGLYIGF